MDLSIINSLCNMSIEELKDWIESQVYSDKEKEAVEEGKRMVDNLSEFSANDSPNKVMITLIAYTIYKEKGGK